MSPTAEALLVAEYGPRAPHPLSLSDFPCRELHAWWSDCPSADPDCPVLLDAEVHAVAAEWAAS